MKIQIKDQATCSKQSDFDLCNSDNVFCPSDVNCLHCLLSSSYSLGSMNSQQE